MEEKELVSRLFRTSRDIQPLIAIMGLVKEAGGMASGKVGISDFTSFCITDEAISLVQTKCRMHLQQKMVFSLTEVDDPVRHADLSRPAKGQFFFITEPGNGQIRAQPDSFLCPLPFERACPQFAMVGIITIIDALFLIVGKQLINAAEKMRIIFRSYRICTQDKPGIIPQKFDIGIFQNQA